VAAPSDNLFDLRDDKHLKYRNTEREARSRERREGNALKLEKIRIAHEKAFSASYSGDDVTEIRKQAVEKAKCQRKWKLSW